MTLSMCADDRRCPEQGSSRHRRGTVRHLKHSLQNCKLFTGARAGAGCRPMRLLFLPLGSSTEIECCPAQGIQGERLDSCMQRHAHVLIILADRMGILRSCFLEMENGEGSRDSPILKCKLCSCIWVVHSGPVGKSSRGRPRNGFATMEPLKPGRRNPASSESHQVQPGHTRIEYACNAGPSQSSMWFCMKLIHKVLGRVPAAACCSQRTVPLAPEATDLGGTYVCMSGLSTGRGPGTAIPEIPAQIDRTPKTLRAVTGWGSECVDPSEITNDAGPRYG